MQSVTGPRGNCFSACLASMFECDISAVPNFYEIAGDDDAAWWAAVRDWLRMRGFGIMFLELSDPKHIGMFEGWFIVSGKSARGVDHATIWCGGEMRHDPHPSNGGLVKPDGIDLIYPLDAARLSLR
mgnify:CR=1 FL=1